MRSMLPRSLSFDLPQFDPLAAFLHLAPDGPGFLESQNPNPRTGRYSIVPLSWQESYRLDQEGLWFEDGSQRNLLGKDPFACLGEIFTQRSQTQPTELLFPGGFFGLFGYDLAKQIENLPALAERDWPVPAIDLTWVDSSAVYDHLQQTMTLATLNPETDLDQLASQILSLPRPELPSLPSIPELPQPLLRQDQFEGMVRRAKEYIAAGDIYQANLSCRFDGGYPGSSAQLYQHLRAINPSPFGGLLQFPDLDIISSSPERLVSLCADLAETRPIAGTRPRGFNEPEDSVLGKELLAHPKERAEHIMLLDLERNDLGKVCRTGSIEVDELMVLERYSHVTHIVSNVRGRLRPDCGPFDLLKATFPGGTITGVPKKRCMEIIEELEPVGRGSYTGSLGYISVNGRMDLNILIRGYQKSGSRLSYQVGAGIVADSDPLREWHECLAKGAALRRALEVDNAG